MGRGPYQASKKKADAQRERVLAESTEIFSKRGYRATSMNEIADAVGLSKATLYHYFTSKEELLVRLYTNMLDESLQMGRESIASAATPFQALRDLISSRVAYTCRNRALLTVCFEEEHELPDRLFVEVVERRHAFELLFLTALQEHLADHPNLLTAMPPTIFMNTCLGAANWCYKWYRPEGPLSPEELGERMAHTLTATIDPARQAGAPQCMGEPQRIPPARGST